MKDFRHLAFWRHGTRLANFFIAPIRTTFFEAHFLGPGNFGSAKLQGFHGTPPLYLAHQEYSVRGGINDSTALIQA